MAVYSIKELEILSGIKAHTIRVWEQRYKMFAPVRTDTNIRRYSDDDVRRALNISMLQNMGYKISHIARMSDEEKGKLVTKGNGFTSPPPVPEGLFELVINLDKKGFTKKINESIKSKGLEWTYENLIIPFQLRVGMLWQAGTLTPAHEHFASNIIRDILINAINGTSQATLKNPTIIFFLPEGELHEMGLLYYNYIAASKGFQTLYMGQNTPVEDVIEIALSKGIKLIFTSFTVNMPDEYIQSIARRMQKELKGTTVFVSGHLVEVKKSILPKGLALISSSQQFKEYLDSNL